MMTYDRDTWKKIRVKYCANLAIGQEEDDIKTHEPKE